MMRLKVQFTVDVEDKGSIEGLKNKIRTEVAKAIQETLPPIIACGQTGGSHDWHLTIHFNSAVECTR